MMFGRNRKSRHRKQVPSVMNWAVSFENLLEDPAGLKTFTEFLRREFSAENIMFWMACKQYCSTTDKFQMRSLAKEIYDRHLRPGSPEAVNINSATRQFVIRNVKDSPSNLFQQAQKEIFILMKFDCYQRFLKSELFTDSLTAEKLGKPLACDEMSGSKSPRCSRLRSKSRDRNREISSKLNAPNFVNNNELIVNNEECNTKKRKSFLTSQNDLTAVWNRAQERLDDQRGTELNCDLPEFLKDKPDSLSSKSTEDNL